MRTPAVVPAPQEHVDRELAALLERRIEDLLDVWENLGSAGPSLHALETEPDPKDVFRARYLRPLARLLIGALRGSAAHRAVYIDERLRYVDPMLGQVERAARLRELIDGEIGAVSLWLGETADSARAAASLKALHRSLLHPASDNACRILFIGDCLFSETRAFLSEMHADDGSELHIRHIFFSARRPLSERNDAIIAEVTRTQPAMVGLSLVTFEGVPPWTSAWNQAAAPVSADAAWIRWTA